MSLHSFYQQRFFIIDVKLFMTILMFLNKERPLHSNLIAKMGMARDEPR